MDNWEFLLGAGGFYDGDEEFEEFFDVWVDGLVAFGGDVAWLVKEVDPVECFVGFLKGDTHFVDEVGTALGVFRFPN